MNFVLRAIQLLNSLQYPPTPLPHAVPLHSVCLSPHTPIHCQTSNLLPSRLSFSVIWDLGFPCTFFFILSAFSLFYLYSCGSVNNFLCAFQFIITPPGKIKCIELNWIELNRMYEGFRIVMRCALGVREKFKVEVELHQGWALSAILIAMVMDKLTDEVRQETPWTMMFADVLRAGSRLRRT